MKKVIIIGGPSRSGTNTISSFLHLHEDIIMFCSLAGAFNFNLRGIWAKLNLIPKRIQLQQALTRQNDWKDIFIQKNEAIKKGMRTPIYGVRYDYVEKRMNGSPDAPVYFVYSMRNLKELYFSQEFCGFLQGGVKQFERRVGNSLDVVLKLGNVFPMNVSEDANYQGLLDWLQLESNEHQEMWMEQNPVTNNPHNDPLPYEEFKKKDVDIPDVLLQKYSRTKEELLNRL